MLLVLLHRRQPLLYTAKWLLSSAPLDWRRPTVIQSEISEKNVGALMQWPGQTNRDQWQIMFLVRAAAPSVSENAIAEKLSSSQCMIVPNEHGENIGKMR
jgi:hypothetical protein